MQREKKIKVDNMNLQYACAETYTKYSSITR